MKHKKYIFLFILTISISLFVIGCIYNIVSGKPLKINLAYQFIINLPLCIALGFIDFGVINCVYKRLKSTSNVVRISIDLLLTTCLSVSLAGILNCLLAGPEMSGWDIFKSSLPVIPWNWIAVFQIEIFFYNLQQTEMEKRLAVIEKERALYQFEVLKNQINPHFLFNSLNVLASLTYQDAEKANLFTKKLSTVYRYLLTTHGQLKVTLKEELSFVDSYLYLEHIRFGDTLHIDIEDNGKNHNRFVIPASIQMLVENAIKHNISTTNSPLIIHITIDDEMIIVSNNLQLRNYVTKSGTGLKNLQRQYALYNRQIDIFQNEKEFAVQIPFLD